MLEQRASRRRPDRAHDDAGERSRIEAGGPHRVPHGVDGVLAGEYDVAILGKTTAGHGGDERRPVELLDARGRHLGDRCAERAELLAEGTRLCRGPRDEDAASE
jgi:hypothetical protein